VPSGTIDQILLALVADYELTGDVLVRLLAQEDRHPVLRRILNFGRAGHRGWVEEVFAPWIAALDGTTRERRIAALITVTDVYTWKLLRRDLGHTQPTVVAVMRDLVRGLVNEPTSTSAAG
jgi:hypothetical protein